MNYLDNTYHLDQKSGHALSAKHQRVGELIQDFDPELELCWIPPGQRTAFDKHPFAVYHNGPAGRYMVMSCTEDEVDERLVAKIFAADNRQGSVLDKLEALEAARKALQLKRQMDEFEEANDLARHIIKSPLHAYTGPNKVVYRS